MTRLPVLLCSLALLAAAGCSDDEPTARPEGSPAAEAGSPAADAGSPAPSGSCLDISGEQLAQWSGLPQALTEESGAEAERCSTKQDAEGMQVTWEYLDLEVTFADLGSLADLPGLDRSRLELSSGSPAWLVSGRVAGGPQSTVVTLVGDRPFKVMATGFEFGVDDTAAPQTLEKVATAVAAAQTG